MLAVAVFVVVYAWNEFLFAFIFTSTTCQDRPACALGNDQLRRWRRLGRPFAASTVQLAPVLLFVMLS